MKNTYIFMIVQALLTLLLFFSEGYVKYTTIALFLLIDLVLFIGLLMKRWSYEELLIFAAIFCSGVFILFYIFMKSAMTTLFGVALMLLFLVIAMLDLISKPLSAKDSGKFEKLQLPEAPSYYYDVEYDPQVISRTERTPEPVMHIQRPVSKDKLAAKAIAYELEREAQQIKDAERMIKSVGIYNAERELIRETKELENAQKQMNALKNAANKVKTAKKNAKELKREAQEIMKVQKQINDIKAIKELEKEAKAMKKAETQVKEIQFLNKQEKIVKQAKQIAKAQKEIDEMNKNTKKSLSTSSNKPKVKEVVRVRTVKAKDESFYFATENGNKFHEPGCLAIKKVPKNKLTLYTSRKEAMKKGLQPCNVCIPNK